MRDQLDIGLGVCEKFMQKRCFMVRSADRAALTSMVRRVCSDATSRFQGVDLQRMHHIGYIDMTKYGRLTVPDINEAAQWALQVLEMNESFSTSFLYCIFLLKGCTNSKVICFKS